MFVGTERHYRPLVLSMPVWAFASGTGSGARFFSLWLFALILSPRQLLVLEQSNDEEIFHSLGAQPLACLSAFHSCPHEAPLRSVCAFVF